MSVREIRGHLEEIYGIDVSPDLISAVTDAVLEEVERMAEPAARCRLSARLLRRHPGQDPGRGLRSQQGDLHRARHPAGRHEGDSRHLDRADRGRQILAARHERAEEPRRRRYPDRRRRRPERLSRGDQRGLSPDRRADLHRASDPPFAGVRVLEGPQSRRAGARAIYRAKDAEAGMEALEDFEAGFWGQDIRRSPRAGGATGITSSRSSRSPRASGGSSTRPTPSRP